MRVYNCCVWDISNKTPVLVATSSRIHAGKIAWLKGATSEQKALEQSQQNFYNTLTQNYNTQFANQQAIFSAIKAVYDPVLNAGPNQYGFSQAEDTTLRTQATEGTAANYRSALQSTAEKLAASGGGNSFLPSGAAADINARIAGSAAGQESEQQLGITKAGYEVGRENFQNATNAEMGVAAGYNPLGYAGATTSAGNSAFNMASEIQKANAAASPWGTIGGLVGGLAGSFLGPMGTAVGSKIGGFLGNAGSGNAAASGSAVAGGVPLFTGGTDGV